MTFNNLFKRANYAINSYNFGLVCEVYGMAKMARELEAITNDEFMFLNRMLVREGMNNAKWMRKAEL